MVNRVLRDDPTKSSMHNREGLTVMKIWKILKDWRMWPIYVLGIIFMGTFLCRGYAARTYLHPPVPVTTPQTYLTLSLRNLGFSTTQSNLLSIPSKVLGMLLLLVFCYLSEVVNSRISVLVLLQLWALPLLIALYTFTTNTSPWAYYAVVTLIVGGISFFGFGWSLQVQDPWIGPVIFYGLQVSLFLSDPVIALLTRA